MKRGQTDICALVAIDKPGEMTSHDVVNIVRRATGERRVGHAGTLDPFATGVLIVGIGPATRLCSLIAGKPKSYSARIVFGSSTTTDDRCGDVLMTGVVPDRVLDREYAQSVLESFTGTFPQMPPQYSAKKIDGRKSYELARRGSSADLKPVDVTVYSSSLHEIKEEGPTVFWDVDFTVSKGTYIRSLARDIGERCGCFAHLGELRRTSACGVPVENCISLSDFESGFSRDMLKEICLNPVELLGIPCVEVDAEVMQKVSNGAPLELEGEHDSKAAGDALGDVFGIVHKGKLMALYTRVLDNGNQADDGKTVLKSRVVFPDGVWGVR
ncbi:MAG: tRNA pseudouridine(55) synthase TruB [Coriobacteriales bacterium]